MSSSGDFAKELALNIRANHPVTMVHTSDPFDSLELIKDALPVIRPDLDKVFYWSATSDWIDFSERDKDVANLIAYPMAAPVDQETKKSVLSLAFKSPEFLGGRKPVFIVSLFSIAMKKDKVDLIQQLRDFDYLVRNGINETYRIIVIANKAFEVNEDYDNLFGNITHNNPTREEIKAIYQEQFVSVTLKTVVSKAFKGDFNEPLTQFAELENYSVDCLSGLTGRQSAITLNKAAADAAIRDKGKIVGFDYDKFKAFLYRKKYEEINRLPMVSLIKGVPLEKVGGLENVKEWLGERAFAYSDKAKERGVKKPKGALLVGPPGTGKTLISRAFSGLLDRPNINLDLSGIFDSLVGESEKQMAQAIRTIETLAPCVVTIEEIDKIFSGSADGAIRDGGATTRVLAKLLTWQQDTEYDVFLAITANRIENVPPEILRKGRLDEIFFVDLPNKDERISIFDIHLNERGYSVNLSEAIKRSQGFSSSEIEYVVNEAVLKAAIRDEELQESHILEIIDVVVPQSTAFKESIERMQAWARLNAKPASKPETPKSTGKLKLKEDGEVEF